MSYTLYDICIPVAQKVVSSFSDIIKKAEAAPNADSLLETRLYHDMHPLTFQAYMVVDRASKLVARLSGTEPIPLKKEDFKTYADIHAHLALAQDILAKADKDLINSCNDKIVPLGLGPGRDCEVPGHIYVNAYVLPNIYFHVAIAYAILRKEGVPLAKADYLLAFLPEDVIKAALG